MTPAEALAWAVRAAERHEDHMSRWVDSGLPPVAQRRRNHTDAVEVVAGLRECCDLLGIEQPPVALSWALRATTGPTLVDLQEIR